MNYVKLTKTNKTSYWVAAEKVIAVDEYREANTNCIVLVDSHSQLEFVQVSETAEEVLKLLKNCK